MVVPMQKDEGLFVDDNEEGVDELTGYRIGRVLSCRKIFQASQVVFGETK